MKFSAHRLLLVLGLMFFCLSFCDAGEDDVEISFTGNPIQDGVKSIDIETKKKTLDNTEGVQKGTMTYTWSSDRSGYDLHYIMDGTKTFRGSFQLFPNGEYLVVKRKSGTREFVHKYEFDAQDMLISEIVFLVKDELLTKHMETVFEYNDDARVSLDSITHYQGGDSTFVTTHEYSSVDEVETHLERRQEVVVNETHTTNNDSGKPVKVRVIKRAVDDKDHVSSECTQTFSYGSFGQVQKEDRNFISHKLNYTSESSTQYKYDATGCMVLKVYSNVMRDLADHEKVRVEYISTSEYHYQDIIKD